MGESRHGGHLEKKSERQCCSKLKSETDALLTFIQEERQMKQKQNEELLTFLTNSRLYVKGEDKEYS